MKGSSQDTLLYNTLTTFLTPGQIFFYYRNHFPLACIYFYLIPAEIFAPGAESVLTVIEQMPICLSTFSFPEIPHLGENFINSFSALWRR